MCTSKADLRSLPASGAGRLLKLSVIWQLSSSTARGLAPALVSTRSTVVVLRVPSVDEVESRKTISLLAASCWVRSMILVTTKTAQMVFHQKWHCQHSSVGKTAGRHATNCPAFVDIKIKQINNNTKKNDAFLKKPVPLAAVIKLREDHNHNPDCADGLRLLKSTAYTRALFHGYFKSEDGSCWAVLVVTKIMLRTQQLAAASEIVFLDSTSATAQLPDNRAFQLLKDAYPVCFGGAHAPEAFMTDNASAEKAALRTTWPEAVQLLCHFHVAQAKWRWL
ncbi:hypothetical protein ISCGN_011114 [Ixodes scapularis]